MSENGQDLPHFLLQDVVLFMALGPLEVSESNDLGIRLLYGKNNCKGKVQDRTKTKHFPQWKGKKPRQKHFAFQPQDIKQRA